MPRGASRSKGLWLIAAFKLINGLALLAGMGALKLLHKDVASEAEHWMDVFRVDAHKHYIHRLLEKLTMLDDRKLMGGRLTSGS